MRTGKTLSDLVYAICRYASYPSRGKGEDISWQDGFHDHKMRAGESVVDVVRYIEANPVRKDLVDGSAEWMWSSAHPNQQGRLDRNWLGHERWGE